MNHLHKFTAIGESWRIHTRNSLSRYAATMTQVEALRVEVSALEAEIRRTERSALPRAHKDARIRGLASRASESYGRMLSLLREAADIYPAIVAEPLDIPRSFTRRERERQIKLPERPTRIGLRDVSIFMVICLGFTLAAMVLSKLYPIVATLPVLH